MKRCLIVVLCLGLALTAAGCAVNCTHVDSPHGEVAFGEKVCSPDDKLYAREIEPQGRGRLGIFDKATGRLVREVQLSYHPHGYANPLKGLAWSPDGKRLAAMYHYDGQGHVSIVSVDDGKEVKSIPISKYYHSMKFSSDRTIDAGGDTLKVE